MSMWAARVEHGYLFGDLTPVSIETLKGVPMLIESTDERVRRRLLPETCIEPEDEAHWRQHGVPELERLFLSRAQLVRRDLRQLELQSAAESSVLLIPDEHVNAWLAALNAARLALFVLNDMTAEHMEVDGFATATPKQQEAALRIELLAEIQGVLLGEFNDHRADDDDVEDDTDDADDDDADDDGLDPPDGEHDPTTPA